MGLLRDFTNNPLLIMAFSTTRKGRIALKTVQGLTAIAETVQKERKGEIDFIEIPNVATEVVAELLPEYGVKVNKDVASVVTAGLEVGNRVARLQQLQATAESDLDKGAKAARIALLTQDESDLQLDEVE